MPKDDNGSKCYFYIGKPDPIVILKKSYGENWKKVIAQKNGYDLNISEEEIRKKLTENMNVTNSCQYVRNSSNFTLQYVGSVTTIDGIVKYDCGEG